MQLTPTYPNIHSAVTSPSPEAPSPELVKSLSSTLSPCFIVVRGEDSVVLLAILASITFNVDAVTFGAVVVTGIPTVSVVL